MQFLTFIYYESGIIRNNNYTPHNIKIYTISLVQHNPARQQHRVSVKF
jgi:hypothetical protein